MKLNNATQRQFIIYLLVGGINTLFGYSVFAFFIFFNTPYYLAFLIATLLGLFFNFMTTGTIVFKNNDFSIFYKFIFISILLYFIQIALIKIINKYINNFYISGLMTISSTSLLAFFLNKKVFVVKSIHNNTEKSFLDSIN